MPTNAVSATAVTYTTIPISVSAVISRSIQNLRAALRGYRPWPEFLSTTSLFDYPRSSSDIWFRFRGNSKYFSVNYAVIIAACAAASLMGSPIQLIIMGSVFTAWLLLYFFREDPLFFWGHNVSDWIVLLGLTAVSAVAISFCVSIASLMIGIEVGFLISVVHTLWRNPEGLFLDENDAVSSGLIAPNPNSLSTNTFSGQAATP